MMDFITPFIEAIRWQDAVDFIIIYYLVYRMLLLIKGTRAIQMLTGFGVVVLVFLLSRNFGFYTLYIMLKELLSPLVIVLIIIFQDDIRRALTHFGRNPFFAGVNEITDIQVVEEISRAAFSMAKKKIGAILVLERETGLRNFVEEGVTIDAKIDSELLVSIFLPYGPMHDGAVIIQDGRIRAAGCFLPMSQSRSLPKQYGSRHRAAIGLSEQTDAIILVVSEETADVSLIVEGKVKKGFDQEGLSKLMLSLLVKKTSSIL